MAGPYDYTTPLAQGQQFVPDVAMQAAQRQLLQARAAEANQQIQFQQIALMRQRAFGQDMQNFLTSPSVSGVAAMFGKYPEFQQQIQDAWGTLSAEQKRSELTQLGSAAALTAKGDYDGAADLVQSRIQADQAAGRDTSTLQQMYGLLQSKDPTKITPVLGMMSAYIAGGVGPDKAADYLKGIGLNQEPQKLSPGEKEVNTVTGQTVASSPALSTPQTLNTPSGGQQLYSFNPNDGSINGGGAATTQPGGGGPASGGAVAGPQAAIAHVLGNEGGYNPSDMNGSPTNFGINFKANKSALAAMGINASNFKNMTQDQAEQIYAQKYWPQSGAANLPENMQAPYFDVYVRSPALAKSALAKSGGDPAKFMAITSQAFQKMAANNPRAAVYAQAWANRDAGNLAIATGQGTNAVPNAGGGQAPQTGPQPLVSTDNGGLNTKGAEPGYAWNATHTAQIPVPGTPNDPNSYAPQEIDDLARNWIATGPAAFASLGGGMGGGGGIAQLKKAALARATQIMAASGITADQLPAFRARYNGLNTSLQQATTTLNSLQAAQDGLQRDANLVLTTQKALADKAPNNPDGMGIIKDVTLHGVVSNNWVNQKKLDYYGKYGTAQQQAAVKAYEDAVNAYASSYSKFMTAANGVGGSAAPSDAARAQAGELNDLGMGPTATRTHLQTVLAEANNKVQGWQHQATLVRNQLSNMLPQGSQAAAAPQGEPIQVNSIQQAQSLPSGTLFRAPNGQISRKH